MKRITLDNSILKKLQKESGGDRETLFALCRESIAGKWLKSNGIPSWRNPSTPVKITNNYSSHNSRYSILLADGSRFLVCAYPLPSSYSSSALFRDILAASKCFAAVAVSLENDHRYGSVRGCVFLNDTCRSRNIDLSREGLESTSKLLHYLGACSNYNAVFIRFSIRLLLLGEPDAPGAGTDGVTKFNPVRG